MDILYIGPFQKTDNLGYISSSILQYLCSLNNHTTFAYPIYSGFDNQNISNIPYNRLNSIIKYPDINIQHSSIETLTIDKNSKTYFIPIQNQDSSINYLYADKIKDVDKIIVFSDFEYKKYLNLGIQQNKLYKASTIPCSSKHQQIDIGIFNTYKKHYFIGDYADNKTHIQILLRSFISSTKNIDDICLLICCSASSAEKRELISFYEQIKNESKANINENKVLFLFDNISLEKINYLHKICDVFWAINNTYHQTTDVYMAQSNNNVVINYIDMNDIDEINIGGIINYTIMHKSITETIYKLTDSKFQNKQIYKEHTIADIL